MLGLDPEVAIINPKTGEGKSAHLFLNEPQQFTFYRDNDTRKSSGMLGSEMDRDGPAIEVRSLVRSGCRDNVIPYVAEALRQAQLLVEKESKGELAISSTAKFVLDDESLKDAPEDVSEFGCNPDTSAYELRDKSPECEVGDLRRWTGGHIHLSPAGAKGDIEQQAALAILFDYYVAAPMVAILGEKFSDGEAERRQYYGQPGSFRYDADRDKIEYRTLSGRLLVSPVVLYWATGMAKAMHNQARKAGGAKELLKSIKDKVNPELVFDTVLNHRVDKAEEIVAEAFPLLPGFDKTDAVLQDKVSGGGGGTYNPFFFQAAAQVFIEANKAGYVFEDDMKWTWGFYEDYMPKHHAYWGLQTAMNRKLDDAIFPQNAVLDKIVPKNYLAKKPIYTHPTLGGDREYTTPGAISWLA